VLSGRKTVESDDVQLSSEVQGHTPGLFGGGYGFVHGLHCRALLQRVVDAYPRSYDVSDCCGTVNRIQPL